MMPPKEKSTKTLQRAGKEGVSPGLGGTLTLPYIRRLGPFLGVQVLNFNIFGGFQADVFFGGVEVGGYDETVDILGAFGKPDNFFFFWGGGISKHSRAIFLWSRYRIGIYLGAANFQLFFGICLGLIL